MVNVDSDRPIHWFTIPVENSATLVYHLNSEPSGWDVPVPTVHHVREVIIVLVAPIKVFVNIRGTGYKILHV